MIIRKKMSGLSCSSSYVFAKMYNHKMRQHFRGVNVQLIDIARILSCAFLVPVLFRVTLIFVNFRAVKF